MRFSSPAPFRPLFVFFALLLVVLLAPQLAAAQSPPPTPKTPHTTPPPPNPADQEQFVAYWTAETGWNSELQLRNNAVGQDLTVTPVLRLANGAETPLAPVTIKPQEVKAIDLDAAIAAAAAPQLVGAYGSIVLRYRSPSSSSLYAAEMIRAMGHAIAFHIDARAELQDFQVGSREGIWWLPKDTTNDYLILANQSKNALSLDLSLYGASGAETKQKILLAPYQTNRYSVRKLAQAAGLAGSYGGIRISSNAQAGSLDTLHFLFDETAGFSALLKMFTRDPEAKIEERDFARTAVWTLRAPMLALSNPDPALAFPQGTVLRPQLFVRNTTPKPLDAALRFNWRKDSTAGKSPGPQLHLLPYETRLIDVAALQGGAVLPPLANWTSVTLTSNALPDELIAVAASYDATLRYGAQTPFSDQLSHQWKGGMWEYDAYHDSIITAGNGGTKPTQAAFTIFYNQGAQRYDLEQTLQPDEQMWIDVGKLIGEHVSDKNGKTLPADLTSGSYEFRDLTHTGVGALFEGKVTYDKTYGHVAYGCAYCCIYSRAALWYNPILVHFYPVSDGVNAYNNCDQGYVDVSDSFYGNWSSANTGIVTVDTYGNHTGVSVGSTTSQTSGELEGRVLYPECPLKYFGPSGGANTIIISQSASLWYFGYQVPSPSGFTLGSTSATLTANGVSNGTFTWTVTNGASKLMIDNTFNITTVTKTDVNTLSISSESYSTQANDVTVQLQYTPPGGSAVTVNWTLSIDSPYKLVGNGTPTNAGVSSCSNPGAPGTDGFQTLIPYRILSFFGTQIANIGINESFFSFQSVYQGETWPTPNPNGAITPDGTFKDNICIVGVFTPQPLIPQSPLSTVEVDIRGQAFSVGSTTPAIGVQVQTDYATRYQDHGVHASLVSPVR